MISLPPPFQLDIQSKQTSISPLIIIDNDIYISTVKGIFNVDTYWEDYNLKISNISESIDIENKKFKINNVSFSLSNYPQNNIRFSDFVAEKGLINKFIDKNHVPYIPGQGNHDFTMDLIVGSFMSIVPRIERRI